MCFHSFLDRALHIHVFGQRKALSLRLTCCIHKEHLREASLCFVLSIFELFIQYVLWI